MRFATTSLIAAACALAAASTAEAKGNRIVFNGCVTQKVMKGALCTYVGQFSLGGTPRPDPFKGLGISGNGLRNPLVTVCGGIGLTHVSWQYNKMKCPKPARPH